jgi:hypothetical protein
LVGASISARLRLTPELFYRQLFNRCLMTIGKTREAMVQKNKKAAYPGLSLLIVVDHLVRDSKYADYSELEPFVTYQFVRSLYTARLSKRRDSSL